MQPERLTTITLEDQIHAIEHDVLEMASRAELMFIRAMDAIGRLDQDLAKDVIVSDEKVDKIDLRIEAECLNLLSSAHPEGSDLRVIGTVLKIITDIERVADLSVDICRCAIRIDRELGESRSVDLPKIAEIARAMFHLSIESYVRQDIHAVERVVLMENIADELFREIRDQIHEKMREHHEDAVTLSVLLIALHDIERVADHAVNIAERVQSLVAGQTPTN